mmetsp:Transcript_28489/g.43072  ORF Transcript_28489/g.43072 Transcript_28489/m.43072 type:complete len:252 (-) Transcript_28489:591-1346(-)
MVVTGFSLSPGGLLFPYHVGALASLEYNGHLSENTPLAGSSAGSIAVAAQACGVLPEKSLEAAIKVSDNCAAMGGAKGRLLPFVSACMDEIIGEKEFGSLVERRAPVGICYRELFPRNKAILKTNFDNKGELIQAVSNSCMFPFFSTNWPCTIDNSGSFPRLVVDGFFAVPRERFGCPDFEMAGVEVDRTVSISVFPKDKIGLTAFETNDQISPPSDISLEKLFRIATESTSREELTFAYEQGWKDAEKFV